MSMTSATGAFFEHVNSIHCWRTHGLYKIEHFAIVMCLDGNECTSNKCRSSIQVGCMLLFPQHDACYLEVQKQRYSVSSLILGYFSNVAFTTNHVQPYKPALALGLDGRPCGLYDQCSVDRASTKHLEMPEAPALQTCSVWAGPMLRRFWAHSTVGWHWALHTEPIVVVGLALLPVQI